MPLNPDEKRSSLEAYITKNKLSPADAVQARSILEQQIAQDAKPQTPARTSSGLPFPDQGAGNDLPIDPREQFRANVASARAQYPTLAKIGSLISAGMNYGNMAAGGLPARGAAALTAPVTALMGDKSLGDAYNENLTRAQDILGASPVSQAVGETAALVAPTPMGAVVGKAASLAGAPMAEAAAKAADAGASIAQIGARQLFSSLASSAGAVGAYDAVTGLPDAVTGRKSAGEIVSKAVQDFSNPVNLATAGIGGALATAFRVKPDLAKIVDIEKWKRWGYSPTAADYRPEGSTVGSITETISKSPAGRGMVRELADKGFYQPLRKSIQALQDTLAGGKTPPIGDMNEKAAAGLTRALGDRTVPGSLASQIAEKARATAPEFAAPLPAEDARALLGEVNRIAREHAGELGTRGEAGTPFANLISGQDKKGSLAYVLSQISQGSQATLQSIGNIISRIDDTLDWDALARARSGTAVIANADQAILSKTRGVLRQYLRAQSPVLDNLYQDIASLREVRDALTPMQRGVDSQETKKILDSLVNARGFRERWDNIAKTLSMDEIRAYAGSYLADFLEQASLHSEGERTALSSNAMKRLWNGSGKFRRDVFDQILPDVMPYLAERGRASDAFRRTIGAPEGSRTFSRSTDAAALAALGNGPAMAMDALNDPTFRMKLFSRVLGIGGTWSLANSLLNGRIRQRLIELATGVPVTTGRYVPAAVAASRDRGGLVRDAGAVPGGVMGSVGGGISALSQLGNQSAPQSQPDGQ
jgi:hypothetical protein